MVSPGRFLAKNINPTAVYVWFHLLVISFVRLVILHRCNNNIKIIFNISMYSLDSLPCLLCFVCMRDTFTSEEKKLKDPRRLYAPGRMFHIVDRKFCRYIYIYILNLSKYAQYIYIYIVYVSIVIHADVGGTLQR